MTSKRITQHPVLNIPEGKSVSFTWNGSALEGMEGEMVSSALFASGIKINALKNVKLRRKRTA